MTSITRTVEDVAISRIVPLPYTGPAGERISEIRYGDGTTVRVGTQPVIHLDEAGRPDISTKVEMFLTYSAHSLSRQVEGRSECLPRAEMADRTVQEILARIDDFFRVCVTHGINLEGAGTGRVVVALWHHQHNHERVVRGSGFEAFEGDPGWAPGVPTRLARLIERNPVPVWVGRGYERHQMRWW